MNWKGIYWKVISIIMLIIFFIVGPSHAGNKVAMSSAEADADQSLIVSAGAAETGDNLYRMQYLHPLWNNVEWSVGIAHTVGEDTEEVETDRTDAVIGLRLFPVSIPLFVQMGLGITKASSDGFRSLVSLGYIVDFSKKLYGELGVGRDFIQEQEDRWTYTAGLGIRF